jgi:hypothetical protein
MHFILIIKKDGFKYEQLDDKLLTSPNAPSLISREAIKYELSNFILYLYPYDHVDSEIEGYSYQKCDNEIMLINGLVNVNNDLRNQNIKEFYNNLNDNDSLHGDFQLVYLNKDGNGFIKTPPLSIRQLFYYENKNFTVISTEIKLIVDGILKFRQKPFAKQFDPDFIEDVVYREWTPRNNPENTIFKGIKRIFPYDTKFFHEGKFVLERKYSIPIPKWFKEAYNNDKEKLYDDYYKFLINFTETNLVQLKPNIDKISLGLTGGFDSRLSVAILAKICDKHQITLECKTSGEDDHPDVIIAKKVAKVLNVKHFHNKSKNIRPNTKDYKEYFSTFYISQGDFNSKDSVLDYRRKLVNLNLFEQLGMDAYKRPTLDKIYSANIWFARRILFHKNFFFPLFFTDYEVCFALLYAEAGKELYKEFVYEILKRSEPELLEIPFAGYSLPQTDVKPYLTVADTKFHEKDPFLWDYQHVRKNLKPVFIKKYNNSLGRKSKIILKIAGLNEFDYFFNLKIGETIDLYRRNQINIKKCINILIKEGRSERYPKSKTMIKLTKKSGRDPYITKMQILMDASAANKNSFQEIEEDLIFLSQQLTDI